MSKERRARRYLQASMESGYTGLPAEVREAKHSLMRSHERAYRRVREHAIAGADRDFDQPLTAGEREHQRHLRERENYTQAEVQRVRKELREPHRPESSRRERAQAGAQPGAQAAREVVTLATPSPGGNPAMQLIGMGLFAIFVYLLVAGKGAKAVGQIVSAGVGAVDAFIKPVDPIAKLEKALGATPVSGATSGGSASSSSSSTAGGTVREGEVKPSGLPPTPAQAGAQALSGRAPHTQGWDARLKQLIEHGGPKGHLTEKDVSGVISGHFTLGQAEEALGF